MPDSTNTLNPLPELTLMLTNTGYLVNWQEQDQQFFLELHQDPNCIQLQLPFVKALIEHHCAHGHWVQDQVFCVGSLFDVILAESQQLPDGIRWSTGSVGIGTVCPTRPLIIKPSDSTI